MTYERVIFIFKNVFLGGGVPLYVQEGLYTPLDKGPLRGEEGIRGPIFLPCPHTRGEGSGVVCPAWATRFRGMP